MLRAVRDHEWFFLNKKCLALPVFAGLRRVGTTAAADFCSFADADCSVSPWLSVVVTYSQAKAEQISPNKSVNYPCTSSASTNPPFPICLRVLKHARLERPASMRFLYVASQVLARRCPATILCRLNDHLRRLPSHGRSSFRSCPRLVSVSYELFIWYYDSCKKIGTKHRGLRTLVEFRTPQTHAHVGRT